MNSVHIIYTGGTIGGYISSDKSNPEETNADACVRKDTSVEAFAQQMRNCLPSWVRPYSWSVTSPFRQLSENMYPTTWLQLAQSVEKAIKEGASGIVVAHGTDTLAYSGAALSLMLRDIQIPIVLTGSNTPISATGTDAAQNLAHSIFFATRSQCKGVYVSFAGTPDGQSVVMLADRTRKDASRLDCFQPAFGPPFALIAQRLFGSEPSISYNHPKQPYIECPRSFWRNGLVEPCSDISYFQLYPGFPSDILLSAIERGAKAMILGAYGIGTACARGPKSLLPVLSRITTEIKVPVFIISQHYGYVVMNEYASARLLKDAGCIPLGQLTPEYAIVKLMCAVGQTSDSEEIVELMHSV